jgi:hypothetical protein
MDEDKRTRESSASRGDGVRLCTWVHKAKELPKGKFKREVERYLTGQETEPWELISSTSTRASCRLSSVRSK